MVMRYDSLSSWQKALEVQSVPIPSLVLITSPESYALELAWQAFRERLHRMPRWSVQALRLLDAEEHAPAMLFEELQTLPFLVPFKVVLLRHADKLPLADRKRLDALLTTSISQAKHISLYTVIMASQWNKNSALYTACQEPRQEVALVDIPVAKGAARETIWGAWVQQRMQAEGKLLPFPLAKKWIHQLEEISHLSVECAKLLAYVGERPVITETDLEAICQLQEPQSIWQLGEAICTHNVAQAMTIMQFLLDGELSPFALLASLRHQMQTGCRLAELLEGNVPRAQIAAEFPQLVGKLLDNQSRLAREYGVRMFHKALHAITNLEFDLKDRTIDPKRLIERLIFVLSARAEKVQLL